MYVCDYNETTITNDSGSLNAFVQIPQEKKTSSSNRIFIKNFGCYAKKLIYENWTQRGPDSVWRFLKLLLPPHVKTNREENKTKAFVVLGDNLT